VTYRHIRAALVTLGTGPFVFKVLACAKRFPALLALQGKPPDDKRETHGLKRLTVIMPRRKIGGSRYKRREEGQQPREEIRSF